MKFSFNKKELEVLLDNMVIVCDTAEKENSHIKEYFIKTKKRFVEKSLDFGDYSAFIESNEETKALGIYKDLYLTEVVIERKANVNELVGNFAERNRIENEFKLCKYNDCKVRLIVEEVDGYKKMVKGDYKSKMKPKSLIASLEAFADRYNISVEFIDKELAGMKIYTILRYAIKNRLGEL